MVDRPQIQNQFIHRYRNQSAIVGLIDEQRTLDGTINKNLVLRWKMIELQKAIKFALERPSRLKNPVNQECSSRFFIEFFLAFL